jgi:hypothetical protein
MGKRKAYTPFSLSSEAGVSAAPVEGYITVDQEVKPTIDTGFVDRKGNWIGHQTSDTAFGFYQKDEAIANGGDFLSAFGLDMTGFNDIQMAIRPTNGGNYAMTAVMGSDGSQSYANLNPVNAASTLIGKADDRSATLIDLFNDSAQSLTADVWNIFTIPKTLANQKLLQFKFVNNSGGESTVETTFLRIV